MKASPERIAAKEAEKVVNGASSGLELKSWSSTGDVFSYLPQKPYQNFEGVGWWRWWE